MPRATRRTLLTAAPALAAGGSTGATASTRSAVAEAYAAYLLVGRDTYPRTAPSETTEEWEQAEREHDKALDSWFPAHEAAVLRVAEAQSASLADLELKLRFTTAMLMDDNGMNGLKEELVESCLEDLQSLQGSSLPTPAWRGL